MSIIERAAREAFGPGFDKAIGNDIACTMPSVAELGMFCVLAGIPNNRVLLLPAADGVIVSVKP